MKKVHIWLFIISLFSSLWTNAQELVQEANEDLLFDTPSNKLWNYAASSLGFDTSNLVGAAGKA